MKTLKEKFGELSARIKASGQPARAWFPQYTPASLLNAENWWEALAVCEYALDTKEDEKLTEDFFELIFSAFDCNVEVDLNAEEYEFWWEKVIQVCDRVAVFSGAGWAQKGAQYSEARYGKRDMSYLFPYYEKAADMGWAEAEATVAYWRYMGFYCEQNKEEGERRFAALTSPEAILWGKHYRAFVEEFTGDKAKALQIRNDLLAELPEGERLRAHVYAALGDALDRAEGSVAEEAAYYEKSLEVVPNLYTLKNLATLYFRYPELNKPKELGFELWEKAWHAGVWSAANFLGYNYQEEEWLDVSEIDSILERSSFANRKQGIVSHKGISAKRVSSVKEKPVGLSKPRKKQMPDVNYLLVDGYNIIFAWEELKVLAQTDIAAARGKLMDILCNYQGFHKCELILVFDAYRVANHKTEILDYHNIHVVYTKEAETADQYIEKFAHENGKKYRITVATSDGLEQIIIRGAGCRLLSARDFEADVKRSEQAIREILKDQ